MKQFLTTGFLVIILLLSILRNGLSSTSIDLAVTPPDNYRNVAIIYAPENIFQSCLLPENEINPFHSIKKPVTENRLIRPTFSSFTLETYGKLHSAVEYFGICDQIFLKLNISAIIFPFDYHW
ncbi:MAG: hypothetical protein IH597_13765 [Bacteroidales bacterium]|nr:hypothetical protein [Bacteroidales bacterium]